MELEGVEVTSRDKSIEIGAELRVFLVLREKNRHN